MYRIGLFGTVLVPYLRPRYHSERPRVPYPAPATVTAATVAVCLSTVRYGTGTSSVTVAALVLAIGSVELWFMFSNVVVYWEEYWLSSLVSSHEGDDGW